MVITIRLGIIFSSQTLCVWKNTNITSIPSCGTTHSCLQVASNVYNAKHFQSVDLAAITISYQFVILNYYFLKYRTESKALLLMYLLLFIWFADEIPTVVGIFSAFGLVFSVSLFAWICCQRKSSKSNKTPPYKFVHVLKGVDIYPENLNSKKKFGADEKSEAKNKSAMPKNSLHLDLEKKDLNGNFPKTTPKTQSSPDLENLSPKHFAERKKDSVSPDSLKSINSLSSEDKQDKLGTLFFSLEYNFEKKAFVVNIKEARGLPAMDEQSMTSDPYIKMTILPEKKHKVKTRVLRKTLDPAFDETFTFYGIPYSQIQELTLHFMILSFDRFSRDDVIGEVLMPLAGTELSEGRLLMDREIIKRNVRVTYFLFKM